MNEPLLDPPTVFKQYAEHLEMCIDGHKSFKTPGEFIAQKMAEALADRWAAQIGYLLA